MKRFLFLSMLLVASPAFGVEVFKYTPMERLEERLDEHDQQICDLDERVRKLESDATPEKAVPITPATPIAAKTPVTAKPGAKPEITKPQYDFDGMLIVPGSMTWSETTTTSTSTSSETDCPNRQCPLEPKPAASDCPNGQCPLQTQSTVAQREPASLSDAIRESWTSYTYAGMDRGQEHLVYDHLTGEHGYTPSQVSTLTLSEALMLHNLAHGPRINSLIGGRDPAMGSRSSRSRGVLRNRSQRSGWYPGKLLFGR